MDIKSQGVESPEAVENPKKHAAQEILETFIENWNKYPLDQKSGDREFFKDTLKDVEEREAGLDGLKRERKKEILLKILKVIEQLYEKTEKRQELETLLKETGITLEKKIKLKKELEELEQELGKPEGTEKLEDYPMAA